MISSKSHKDLNRRDSLSCIPEKNIHVKEIFKATDSLVLSYQASYRPLLLKVRQLVGRTGPTTFTRKVELDLLGIQVWNLIDGKNDVFSIIHKFAHIYRLDIKEAEVSVTLFIRSLGKKGLVGMRRD